MSLRISLFSLIVLLAVSCKGTGQPPGPFRDLFFRVDSALLGERLSFQGVELRLPTGWAEADAQAMTTIQQAAQRDTGNYGLAPEHVFHDTLGSVLVLSGFRRHTTAVEFIGFARGYSTDFLVSHPARETSQEWLTLGGISALQLYSPDSLRVQFIYLLDADAPVHFAVSVPHGAWEQEVRPVESMLGSVQKVR